MSTEARAEHFGAADWEGGTLPYRVGHRKLGMWLFIVSDSLTFSALLMGYSYLRASNNWPTPFPFYPSIVFSSVMTFCLLSSSLTMVFGVSASSHGNKTAARKWILATIFFGVAFIVLHLIEWNHLIGEGLRPFSLPAHWVSTFTTTDGKLPTPLFGATFANYFAQCYFDLDSPKTWTIFEIGAGRGDFAHAVLTTLQTSFPDVFAATRYLIDEIGDEVRAAAEQKLNELSDPVDFRRLSEMTSSFIGIIFSNELLDAFPVHRVIGGQGALRELCVDANAAGSLAAQHRVQFHELRQRSAPSPLQSHEGRAARG